MCGFEHKEDAENYLNQLRARLAKFGLKLWESKSGIMKFNRHEVKTTEAFTFLGFEFHWAKTKKGRPTVRRRTSKKKFQAPLRNYTEWLKKNRSRPLEWIGEKLSSKLRGYWNYYGVMGNSRSLYFHWNETRKITRKCPNRRSQRKSYGTARAFLQMVDNWGLPRPRIVETLYDPHTPPSNMTGTSSLTLKPCFMMRVLQRSPVREIPTPGSARGLSGNWQFYLN